MILCDSFRDKHFTMSCKAWMIQRPFPTSAKRFQLGQVCIEFIEKIATNLGSWYYARKWTSAVRVKGCWVPHQKIQMGPFNLGSKHLGRCVLFRASCKLAP